MSQSSVKRSTVYLIAITFLAAPASATDYWVDGIRGSDVWTGLCEDLDPGTCTPQGDETSETCCGPKQTMNAALNLATAGDVVKVLPGEYHAPFIFPATAEHVTLQGIGEVVVTLGDSEARQDGVTIDGITFADVASGIVLSVDGTNDSTNGVSITNCRFLGGVQFGLYAGFRGAENLVIRGCLFAHIRRVDPITGAVGGQAITIAGHGMVENNTFYKNGSGCFVHDGVSVRDNSFVENDTALTTGTNPGFFGVPRNHFHANVVKFTGTGTIFASDEVTGDPLFIDPDNDIFFLQAGSPLLNRGRDGRTIGAFGTALHSSMDPTLNQGVSIPAQGTTDPWTAWVARELTPDLGEVLPIDDPDSPFVLGDGQVALAAGVTSAALYSPVFDTGGQFGVVRSIDLRAAELIKRPAGPHKIIDADKLTARREIRMRTHSEVEGAFGQDPMVTPPEFEAFDEIVKFERPARYVQIEILLRNDGQ